MTRLVTIDAPHFCASFVTDGVVQRAAPIIKYMIGWSDVQVRAYVAKKRWKATVSRGAS